MGEPMSRRSFVRGLVWTAGMGATAGAGGSANASPIDGDPLRPFYLQSPRLEPFREQLPVLPTVGGFSVELHANSTVHRFHPELDPSPALGYGGMDYLGPTVEAQVGEPTTIAYRNNITVHPLAADFDTSLHGVSDFDRAQVPTSMHLHGGVTPPQYDGHTEQIWRPGQEYVYRYPNRQEAACLWYHDHAMGVTRLNVYAGLAGLYTLRDEFDTGREDNPLGLPAGEFEISMVMQDKIFTADGHQSIRSSPLVPPGTWDAAMPGDVGVVNGKVWPEVGVARGLYRLRLLNAASFSVWNLFFSNHMRFWVIGTEGGLLDAPAPMTRVRLGPAERVDLLVDFGALESGATVELCNDRPVSSQVAQRGAPVMPMFCRFRVGAQRGFTGTVPPTVRGGRRQPAALPPIPRPQVVRNVTVIQLTMMFEKLTTLMSLNNLMYSSDDIEMPRQGAVEQWNIINVTSEPHPIHLHLVTFRVLGRQAIDTDALLRSHPQPPLGTRWTPSADPFTNAPLSPPNPWETGFKETVIADPNSITRIIVRFPTADELGFDPDATFAAPGDQGDHGQMNHGQMNHGQMNHGHGDHGRVPATAAEPRPLQGYMWHCHMLDHEDHDMMLRYRIIA